MKNSSGWTRSLTSYNWSKFNLRAICWVPPVNLAQFKMLTRHVRIANPQLIGSSQPATEPKLGVIGTLAPSEHGMFFSEGRETEREHRGSMRPSKYVFHQVRERRREKPQTSISEGENKRWKITIRQVAGETGLCTSDPSASRFSSRTEHRNRTAPYVVWCSQRPFTQLYPL